MRALALLVVVSFTVAAYAVLVPEGDGSTGVYQDLAGDIEATRTTLQNVQVQALARIARLRDSLRRKKGDTVASDSYGARKLAGDIPSGITFKSNSGRIKFSSGSTIEEPESGVVKSTTSLNVLQDVVVKGSVKAEGENLNLGVEMPASGNITKGDLVSLVSDGGVARGFGMRVSSPLTSITSEAVGSKVVSVGGTNVVIAYQVADGSGWISYYDTSTSAAQAPKNLGSNRDLRLLTLTSIETNKAAACFGTTTTTKAHCSAVVFANEALAVGTEVDLPDSSTVQSIAVSGLYDASDRIVAVFSAEATPGDVTSESMRAQVLSVSGSNLTPVGTPRILLQSSMGTDIVVTSLTSAKLVVAYKVPRESNSEVREIYFRESSNVDLDSGSRFNLFSDGGEGSYLDISRLDDSGAVVVYRRTDMAKEVSATVVTRDGALLRTSAPEVLSSGTSAESGLEVSVAAVSPTRISVMYTDADNRPVAQDLGVFDGQVIAGRSQFMHRGSENPTGTLTQARLSDTQTVAVSREVVATGSAPGAIIQACTIYGGPTIMGFAKTPATVGGTVTVVLQGGVGGFGDLEPGAPYYARYDGGIAAVIDEVSGASSLLVGRSLSQDVLLSTIGADGEQNKAAIANARKELSDASQRAHASVDATMAAITTKLGNIESAFENTHYMRSDLPIYRWAQWSTYSQAHGQWYAGNNPDMFGGVHASNWGDNNHRPIHMSANKDILRTLFTREGYGGWNVNVCADEWYSYSSTNSKHCSVLFRIRNTKDVDVSWRLYFYYTNYGGWSERAGVAINGAEAWDSGSGNCGAHCTTSPTVTVPANRVSTIIVETASSSDSGTRANFLAFYNDCLRLPDGLEYVNDFATATGGWEA